MSYFFKWRPNETTGPVEFSQLHFFTSENPCVLGIAMKTKGMQWMAGLLSKRRCAFQCAYFTSFFSANFTGTYDLPLYFYLQIERMMLLT